MQQDTKPTSDQIDKIRKLMALAHGEGATEAEAQAAFAKASALMTKWGIEAHQLGGTKEKPEFTFAEQGIEGVWRSRRPAHPFIRTVILECFNVNIIHTHGWDGHRYYMIGTPADMAFASHAFEVLSDVFPKLFWAYLRRTGLPKTSGLRKSYFDGLASGFTVAWHDARKQAMREAEKEAAQSYAIVIVDKAAALTKFVDAQQFRKPRAQRFEFDGHAFNSGVQDGKTIKLYKPLEDGDDPEKLEG